MGRVSVSANRVGEDSHHYYGIGESALDAKGTRVFEALEPGEYVLTLGVRPHGERWGNTTVATQQVHLRPGENTITIAMPVLYFVSVVVPDAAAGTRIIMRVQLEEENSWGPSLSERTDEAGRVRFEDLPAGQYLLQAHVDGSWKQMTTQIPSGDIVFEADK